MVFVTKMGHASVIAIEQEVTAALRMKTTGSAANIPNARLIARTRPSAGANVWRGIKSISLLMRKEVWMGFYRKTSSG